MFSSGDVAFQFVRDNDQAYGVVYKYKPKPQDILLDVSLFARENNIELPYDNESEILLRDNVLITKSNILQIFNKETNKERKLNF